MNIPTGGFLVRVFWGGQNSSRNATMDRTYSSLVPPVGTSRGFQSLLCQYQNCSIDVTHNGDIVSASRSQPTCSQRKEVLIWLGVAGRVIPLGTRRIPKSAGIRAVRRPNTCEHRTTLKQAAGAITRTSSCGNRRVVPRARAATAFVAEHGNSGGWLRPQRLPFAPGLNFL